MVIGQIAIANSMLYFKSCMYVIVVQNDVAESRDTTTIATAAIATDTTTTAVATDTTTSTTAAVATETDTTTVGTRTTATVAVTNFSDTHSVYYEVERVLATNKKVCICLCYIPLYL